MNRPQPRSPLRQFVRQTQSIREIPPSGSTSGRLTAVQFAVHVQFRLATFASSENDMRELEADTVRLGRQRRQPIVARLSRAKTGVIMVALLPQRNISIRAITGNSDDPRRPLLFFISGFHPSLKGDLSGTLYCVGNF